MLSLRLHLLGDVMGYFDGLTNGAFKTDAEGRRLFFIYGALGKGRLLPTERDEQEMRGVFKAFYVYLIIGVMPAVIIGHNFFDLSLTWMLGFGALLILPAYIWIEVKARRYPKVDARLSLGEAYANSAKAHSFWILVLLLVVCALFALLGLVVAFLLPSPNYWIGIGCFAFFGLCAAGLAWMALLNRRLNRV